MAAFRGKLTLLIDDPTALTELTEKWVDTQIAEKLDYGIFMAT